MKYKIHEYGGFRHTTPQITCLKQNPLCFSVGTLTALPHDFAPAFLQLHLLCSLLRGLSH